MKHAPSRLALLGIVVVLAGCDILPWLEHSVRLPDGITTVRIMIRSGGGYRTVVENAFGEASWDELPISGGSRRANLYITPENWLAVMDAGGDSAFFRIASGQPPVRLRPPRMSDPNGWSARWRYLGVVSREQGALRFDEPQQQPECFPMLGAGDSPYRATYQREDFCP